MAEIADRLWNALGLLVDAALLFLFGVTIYFSGKLVESTAAEVVVSLRTDPTPVLVAGTVSGAMRALSYLLAQRGLQDGGS